MLRFGRSDNRPRRWRRRLSDFFSRFSFLTNRCYGRSQRRPVPQTYASQSSYAYLKQTPSSIAATTVPLQVGQPDECFVYDAALSASGSRMYASSSLGRRSPLVFDVYVVIEDDQIILPDYSSRDGSRDASDYSSTEAISNLAAKHTQHVTCSLQ